MIVPSELFSRVTEVTTASRFAAGDHVLVRDRSKQDNDPRAVVKTKLTTLLSAILLYADAALSVAKAILSTSPTGGVGYAAGAGGAVTQLTDKSTGVTLNKVTGAITLNNATLNDATTVTFTVTNSACAAADVPSVVHKSAGTAGAYLVWAHSPASGSFKISVRNVSGGNLGEAIVLQYALVKGAVA